MASDFTPPIAGAYRVLARKYRPARFSDLLGQESLVRTLSNAIRSGRIHQAYMLTGVRGVGKTTSARIIARALNCVGADGQGGPTVDPCGVCDNCRAILADRHVDVLEMDAASNTGVDNIREIIDSARLAPMQARYKVYIIDEVHMLSKGAFNALLKTLEEPPPHVKFIFATTEIRRVPVTVLSRCQRFDLRRLDPSTLTSLFAKIAEAEGVTVEPVAFAMLARAADGSARDGLSLLDQAMALSDGAVTGEQVRDMLGLADREGMYDLLEAALSGRIPDALAIAADLDRRGTSAIVVINDLLDVVHALTRLRLVPALADDQATPVLERTRGAALAARLPVSQLSRAWQLLLKGLPEVQAAPTPRHALDMVLVRLGYASTLPTPADVVRQLTGGGSAPAPNTARSSGPAIRSGDGPSGSSDGSSRVTTLEPVPSRPPPSSLALASTAKAWSAPVETPVAAESTPVANPQSFREIVQLFFSRREPLIAAQLRASAHLLRLEAGLLEMRLESSAPRDLSNRVAQLLTEWTGRRWMVLISGAPGDPTLAEQDSADEAKRRSAVERHPTVKAVLDSFPGAVIVDVRDASPPTIAGTGQGSGTTGSDAALGRSGADSEANDSDDLGAFGPGDEEEEL